MDARSEKSVAALAEEVNVFFRKGAHDIQNLLQMVRLLVKTESKSDKEHAMQLVEELDAYYVDKISQLRRSFEEFQSIRAGSSPSAHLDVAALVSTVLSEMDASLNEDISVITTMSEGATLHYSESHLKSAMRALVDNALRYAEANRPLVINIEVKAVEEGVQITIQDNGTGIDLSRYRDQLFQPFVRCTDQSEGQGISLHLVKMMAEKNGGSLDVVSRPDEGTTVTLYLVNHKDE